MYCLLMAGLARSEANSSERIAKVGRVFGSARLRGYNTEELEEGVNKIIMETNVGSRKRREPIAKYLFLYDRRQEEELIDHLDRLSRQILPGGVLSLTEDQLVQLQELQKNAHWTTTRLLRHFGYRGIPIDAKEWMRIKKQIEVVRKTEPSEESLLVESLDIDEGQARNLDELMSGWKRLKELDAEMGEEVMSEKTRVSERVGEILRSLGLSVGEIDQIFGMRKKMGWA